MVEVHVVDSNRPFATSRSSGGTSALRYAPLAALKAMLAAATTTETTRSWAKPSRPSANAAGTLISAANRVRSIATMTGRLRRNSTHGPSGSATSAPTARPAAASAATWAGPECSTRIAIRGNAPNPSPVPYELTAYAAHNHPNCRPSARLPAMPHAPPRRPRHHLADPPASKRRADARIKQPPGRASTTVRCAATVGGVDLDAVRTFVAAADAGRFQDAAADLSITQQAVSKRIAALEKDLGVRLFTRTARGAQLTIDGQAFLPHARDLLRAAGAGRRLRASRPPGAARRRDRPAARPGRPAARLPSRAPRDRTRCRDPLRRRRGHRRDPVRHHRRVLPRRHHARPARPPDDIEAARVFDEPVQLLTGPAHGSRPHRAVTPAELAGHRIWMPGIVAGTEWAAYYDDLAAAFGLTIEITGPSFGTEPLLDIIADSRSLATFVGEQTRLVWPAHYGLRRIAVRGPTPVYPHSLIWRTGNPHPGLGELRSHLSSRPPRDDAGTWTPAWAQMPAAPGPRRGPVRPGQCTGHR